MNKDEEIIIKHIDEFKTAIIGLLTVYGPSTIDTIYSDLNNYFPLLLKTYGDHLNEMLDLLCQSQLVEKSKKEYSAIPFNFVKQINKVMKQRDILPVGDKDFTARDITAHGCNGNMIDCEEFAPLKEHLQKTITDKKQLESILNELVLLPYLFIESQQAFMIVNSIAKGKIAGDLFFELYDNYFETIPRFFFGGYSFVEYQEELRKLYPDLYSQNEDKLIKTYPSKQDYPVFTYSDLIDLGNKIKETQIYKLIDSDRILELTINGKKVYVQILGFYRKDTGIIIYTSKKELLYTYHFAISDPNKYPDMPYRVSMIEVCLNDPGGFANQEVLDDMKKHNYPEYPSYIRVKANHSNHLANDEEIQLVGGVLSDLLTYIKTNNLSDISLHLGQKKKDDFNIDQVYITPQETVYGGYNEIELGDPFLNYEINPIDTSKIKEVKKHLKKDISVGCYVYPAIMEDDELAYMIIVRDDKTDTILGILVKRLSEMSNIINDLLDLLNEKKVCPKGFFVNNEYTFEMFIDLIDYFKGFGFVEDNQLDDIYRQTKNFNLSNTKGFDNKKFS